VAWVHLLLLLIQGAGSLLCEMKLVHGNQVLISFSRDHSHLLKLIDSTQPTNYFIIKYIV